MNRERQLHSRRHEVRPPTVRKVPIDAIKVPLPDTRQGTDYSCGASCLQAVCGYFGVGPLEEEDYVRVMCIKSNVGAHPHNILRGIEAFGLECREHPNMSVADVRDYLDRGIPVMMMLQAWVADRKRRGRLWKGYAEEWQEGHWVAAIGYDAGAIYLEDPSLAAVRGFLSYRELKVRWHDVGPYWITPYERHMYNYGLAIWKARARRPGYIARAVHID
jgi:predicted double-glycine peptidase